jgi:hypothetical protein
MTAAVTAVCARVFTVAMDAITGIYTIHWGFKNLP